MILYLNLDLLENINRYLFPLFFYKWNNVCNYNWNIIYSPMVQKFIFNKNSQYYISDILTEKCIDTDINILFKISVTWLKNKNCFNYGHYSFVRHKVFISKKTALHISKYLKNNKRIK